MIFLDFEASSLSDASYPVEVGWCDHALTKGWSAIIKSHPAWTEWGAAAEQLHGLMRERIEHDGLLAAEVMGRLNADLAGLEIVSDNPEWEQFWLSRLAAAAGVSPAFTIAEVGFEAVLTDAIEQAKTGAPDVLLVKLLQRDVGVRLHRAMDDALGNALRLGQVAVLALNDHQGGEAAGQFRQRLVASAKRLLELHGRRPGATDQ